VALQEGEADVAKYTSPVICYLKHSSKEATLSVDTCIASKGFDKVRIYQTRPRHMGNRVSKRTPPQAGGVAAGGSDTAALALERELAEAQHQAELLAQMQVPDLPELPVDDMGDDDLQDLEGMGTCMGAEAVLLPEGQVSWLLCRVGRC
jgi:hypothetical protein